MSSRSRATSLLRKVAAGCAVLLGVGVVVGAGGYLAATQSAARQSVLRVFDQRVHLAANLAGNTLLASDPKGREWAQAAFAGPPAGLDAALAAGVDTSVPWIDILDAKGHPLGVSDPSHRAEAATLASDPAFARALSSGMVSFGDMRTVGGHQVIYCFQPFATPGGTRMLVAPQAAADLAGYLRSPLDITGSRSYLIDGTGRVIVTSTDAGVGAPIADARLAAAAAKDNRGTVADDYFVATPVAGSNWRVVVVTSRAGLLAPVDSTARSAWLIFGAFAAAVLLILVIGAGQLISSARLAHARRHDPLTGLPNRALFVERAEAAVENQSRRDASAEGVVAMLFLDLDGFKPVNDTYGHAAGDALLKAVARRLVEATRPEDYVGRFGGDEFLVLCRGLNGEDDAYAVAERVRQDLTQPYEVLGHTVRIGTSIGIAVLGEHADAAETLINNADLALYRAKHNGRGRIERFVPEMANA